MCLETPQSHPNVAESDIVCYKILETICDDLDSITMRNMVDYFGVKPGEWFSPFRHFHYKLGEKLVTEFLADEKNSHVVLDDVRMQKIMYGFHTYAALEDAERFIFDFHTDHRSTRFQIFKAIIPAGTKYYYGKFDGNEPSYASEALIVEKVS